MEKTVVRWSFAMDAETAEALIRLAKQTQRTKGGVIRWLIRKTDEQLSNKPEHPQPTVKSSKK